MGGLAFASDGLCTPRMPPHVYHSVLAHAEEILRAHFKLVGHALEAPEKTSHGDVDILIAEPVKGQIPHGSQLGDLLAKILRAKQWKRMGGSSTYHLALSWPGAFKNDVVTAESKNGMGGDQGTVDKIKNPTTMPKSEANIESDETRTFKENKDAPLISTEPTGNTVTSPCKPKLSTEKHIQIDVNVMPTASYFNWFMFYESHGDLFNMIGGILRRFGLTVSSKGLSVRIAEVEKHNKEQARVLATSDPDSVLDYLGLNKERYWKTFNSWDEMLQYVATCRFHNPARWRPRTPDNESEETKDEELKETQSVPADKLLKANDRRRAAKRPLFGYWIETYLPAHVDDDPGESAFLTREEVVDDVKQFFGLEFAQKFDDRKKKMVRQLGVDKVWADIRKGLPVEGTEIGYVMKGMKREVAGKQRNPPSAGSTPGLDSARAAFDESAFDDVLEWARRNWKEVGERQKKLDQEQSSMHLRDKKKKNEQKAKEMAENDSSAGGD